MGLRGLNLNVVLATFNIIFFTTLLQCRGKGQFDPSNWELIILSGGSRTIAPRKIAPRLITPCMIAPGLLLPENYPKGNWSLTISPWKLPPRKIAFQMISRLHNCPLDKWSRENCPQENKLHPRYFSPRIRILVL